MSILVDSSRVISLFAQSTKHMFVRNASKKASGGGNKNPKQAPGNRKGIWKPDGVVAHEYDIIVHKQTKLWFHPGLNVRLGGRNNLIALKSGKVRFTCEIPNLDMNNKMVQKFYSGQSDAVFYKKYVHVIPDEQHTIFKHVGSI